MRKSKQRTGELVRLAPLHAHNGLRISTPTSSRSLWVVNKAWARCEATRGCRPPLPTTVVGFPQTRQPAASAEGHAAPSGPSLWDLGKNQARLLGQTQQALFTKR